MRVRKSLSKIVLLWEVTIMGFSPSAHTAWCCRYWGASPSPSPEKDLLPGFQGYPQQTTTSIQLLKNLFCLHRISPPKLSPFQGQHLIQAYSDGQLLPQSPVSYPHYRIKLCSFFLTWALIVNTLKSVSFCFWRTTHNIKILPTYPIGRFFRQDLSAGPQKFKPLHGKSSLMFKFGLVASIPHKSPPICPIE